MLTWSFMTPFARGPAKIMNSPSQYTLKDDCTVEKAAIVAEVGATCFRRSCSTPSRESPRMMILIHRCDDVLAKPARLRRSLNLRCWRFLYCCRGDKRYPT